MKNLKAQHIGYAFALTFLLVASGCNSSGGGGGCYSCNGGYNDGGYYNNGGYNGGGSGGGNGGYNGGGSSGGGNGSGNNGGGGNSGNSGGNDNAFTVNVAQVFHSSVGYTNSVGGSTKDVDLQEQQISSANLGQRAQMIANKFGMNFDSARRLTEIADKFVSLSARGKVSNEDMDAITDSALQVAGISSTEVFTAAATGSAGVSDLMAKAASNLGMADASALRDQLLPQLGLKF